MRLLAMGVLDNFTCSGTYDSGSAELQVMSTRKPLDRVEHFVAIFKVNCRYIGGAQEALDACWHRHLHVEHQQFIICAGETFMRSQKGKRFFVYGLPSAANSIFIF
jgi:hypothetical protein